MSHFSLVYLFVLIVNASIFTYLLFIKKKTLQIKSFMVFLALYMATLFCFVMFLSARGPDAMRFWLHIIHYTAPMVNAALIFLVTVFYYDDERPPHWLTAVILLSVMPLLIRDLFGFMDTVSFIPNPIGNIFVYRPSVFEYYFYAYSFIVILVVTVFFIMKYRTTKLRRLRKLLSFLLLALVTTWILSVPGHFLLQYVFEKSGMRIPATGYLTYSIIVVALFYAFLRYSFMKIDIPHTINSIMHKISDIILITDTRGNIVQASDSAFSAFASPKDKLKGMNILELYPGWETPQPPGGGAFSMPENCSEYRKLPHPKKRNQVLDVFFESINDGFGDFTGLLLVCRTNNKFEEKRQAFALTGREIEIITLLHEGLEYQEIAEKLHLSANTVRNHIQNIYIKTGAKNRAQLLKAVF